MKYYIDCEFDGMGGPLISMALIREDEESLYCVIDRVAVMDPWVRENVVPILFKVPEHTMFSEVIVSLVNLPGHIERFFRDDPAPHVIADWPSDIMYLCEALITGPGTMIEIPGITFEVKRVDAYPTPLAGALQHNAYWDAMALRYHLTPSIVITSE